MQNGYALDLDVVSPDRVARWRPLVNWLLVLPQGLWLMILILVLEVLAFISWFVILITGRLPEGFGDFMVGVLRYQWRVLAYLYAWTDQYPTFSLPNGYADPGDYPAVMSATPELERNRFTVLVRIIMVIPQYFVLYFVGIAASVLLFIAWFAVLITGRWPDGMRRFCIGYYRWSIRVQAYFFLVLDAYPPFRLEA